MGWNTEVAFPQQKKPGLTKREYAAIHIMSAMLRWSISDVETSSIDLIDECRCNAYARLAWMLSDALSNMREG